VSFLLLTCCIIWILKARKNLPKHTYRSFGEDEDRFWGRTVAAVRRLAVVDRLVHEREERGEKEMKEREEERARVGSSFPPVVSIDLSWLSRYDYYGVAGRDTAQGGWIVSRTRADGSTKSRHTPWHDWHLHGTMSPVGHMSAPWVVSCALAWPFHTSHQPNWRDSKADFFKKNLSSFIKNWIKKLK
jgi:hypothetical protein